MEILYDLGFVSDTFKHRVTYRPRRINISGNSFTTQKRHRVSK
jgi:hypothetical protein